MSRRHAAEKREILPDAKYGDRVLTKFMNNLMVDGKKSTAERIVYSAFDRVDHFAGKPLFIVCSLRFSAAAISHRIAKASRRSGRTSTGT